MSIIYEANLNCDGKDCKTRPVTAAFHEDPEYAKRYVLNEGEMEDWVTIDDEHYCPECAEKVDTKKDQIRKDSLEGIYCLFHESVRDFFI